MPDEQVNQLLEEHKSALRSYQEWDLKVKELLKGRRMNDLSEEDMEAYREISEKRDEAYNKMRHYERALLDNIPGASTGRYKVQKQASTDEDNQTG